MTRSTPAPAARPATVHDRLLDAADQLLFVDGVIATAQDAGVRVLTLSAEPGDPLVRLAGLTATTDFVATYLAIGLGMDPSVSRHIAQLRDYTRG